MTGRTLVALTVLSCAIATALLSASAAPSMADSLADYAHVLATGRGTLALGSIDLDDARAQLARVQESFLSPRGATPAIREARRQVLLSFAIELAAAGSSSQVGAALRLTEWACAIDRRERTPGAFDQAWQRAALSLIEGSIDAQALAAHIAHLPKALSDEPRVRLAAALVEEQSIAPGEARWGLAQTGAPGANVLTREQARAQHAERAVALFRAAQEIPALRPEADLRMGHVALLVGRNAEALASWRSFDSETHDPALLYLVELFRGMALEGLGHENEARAAYDAALATSPSAHSATMRLAALEFRTRQRSEASSRVQLLLRSDDPKRDPWWSYYAGDWRFWTDRIETLRSVVRPAAQALQ